MFSGRKNTASASKGPGSMAAVYLRIFACISLGVFDKCNITKINLYVTLLVTQMKSKHLLSIRLDSFGTYAIKPAIKVNSLMPGFMKLPVNFLLVTGSIKLTLKTGV